VYIEPVSFLFKPSACSANIISLSKLRCARSEFLHQSLQITIIFSCAKVAKVFGNWRKTGTNKFGQV